MSQHDLPSCDVGAGTILRGLSEFNGHFDAILCDIWGVLHNGATPHPDAWKALVRARDEGISVILVSNAPRPGDVVARSLREMGIPSQAFDDIITSGDLARDYLAAQASASIYHLGPDQNQITFEGLSVSNVGIEAADLILCTDLINEDRDTPEDYRELLGRAAERGLRLICANPDITVERGQKQVYCAGAIARLYEQIGGITVYFGKPHKAIYEKALQIVAVMKGKDIRRSRILCIGDGLHTEFCLNNVFIPLRGRDLAGRWRFVLRGLWL